MSSQEKKIMKFHRSMLSAVLLSLSSLAIAQSDMAMPDVKKSDAQVSFDQLKTLAGSWEGRVSTVPPAAEIEGKAMRGTGRG
jgi:hypothetical protein